MIHAGGDVAIHPLLPNMIILNEIFLPDHRCFHSFVYYDTSASVLYTGRREFTPPVSIHSTGP